MHKRLILLVFLITIFGFTSLKDIPIFNFKVDYFDVDVLGNLYVVRESELIKYDDHQKKIATYSNLSLGEISSIDASDAMNLLVFYEDFAKVLFLDNTLSPKNSVIDLGDLGFPNASLACLSYNNAFWLFDPVNQELIRINQFLEIGERSGNLNQVIDVELDPIQLFEASNNVYLYDPTDGVFIFDRYGGFIKRMPFLGLDDLQVKTESTLSCLRNDTTYIYHMTTLTTDTIAHPFSNIQKIIINSLGESQYYILHKNHQLDYKSFGEKTIY